MKTKRRTKALRRFLGRGTHLYPQGSVVLGWLVVPILCPGETYTFSYLSPTGIRYIDWGNYPSVQAAIEAGTQLVRRRSKEVKQGVD
jgi:hypothetical protein